MFVPGAFRLELPVLVRAREIHDGALYRRIVLYNMKRLELNRLRVEEYKRTYAADELHFDTFVG
jgi:hypothetical protein